MPDFLRKYGSNDSAGYGQGGATQDSRNTDVKSHSIIPLHSFIFFLFRCDPMVDNFTINIDKPPVLVAAIPLLVERQLMNNGMIEISQYSV